MIGDQIWAQAGARMIQKEEFMSRLELQTPNHAQLVVEGLYKDLERRIESSPPGLCPVDISRLSGALSCPELWKMCPVQGRARAA